MKDKPPFTDRFGITPAFLPEEGAAGFLNESPDVRRKRRYADAERLSRGEPIQGPPWIRDGGRIKYRVSDLHNYAENRPNCLTEAGRSQ